MLVKKKLITDSLRIILLKKLIYFLIKMSIKNNKVPSSGKLVFRRFTFEKNLSSFFLNERKINKFKYFLYNLGFFNNFFSINRYGYRHQLLITIAYTKHNFFFSTSTDFKWPFFEDVKPIGPRKGNKTLTKAQRAGKPIWIRTSDMLNTLHVNTTLSSGVTLKKKKLRFKWTNFTMVKELTSLVVSVFWSLINNSTYKQFSVLIRLKGSVKWIGTIVYWIRKYFSRLYYAHRKYIRRYITRQKNKIRRFKNRVKKRGINETFVPIQNQDYFKYKYSLSRMNAIKHCPLYFDRVESFRQIPHNGCKMVKRNRKRKRKNR